MSNNIWDTINSVGPRLKWTQDFDRVWKAPFLGAPIYFSPSKQSFVYVGRLYYGASGYRTIMRDNGYTVGDGPARSTEERLAALEEAVAILLQENA